MYCSAFDCRENLDGDCQISAYITITEKAECDSYDPKLKKEE